MPEDVNQLRDLVNGLELLAQYQIEACRCQSACRCVEKAELFAAVACELRRQEPASPGPEAAQASGLSAAWEGQLKPAKIWQDCIYCGNPAMPSGCAKPEQWNCPSCGRLQGAA